MTIGCVVAADPILIPSAEVARKAPPNLSNSRRVKQNTAIEHLHSITRYILGSITRHDTIPSIELLPWQVNLCGDTVASCRQIEKTIGLAEQVSIASWKAVH